MIAISIAELCTATNGTMKAGYPSLLQCQSTMIEGVSTDTRTIKKNDLFIALKGPAFDAHTLLQNAIDKGASTFIVEGGRDFTIANHNIVIEVKDTRIALGLLAAFIKTKIINLKCAAITGSNGKTTCKELLSAILVKHVGDIQHVLATAGNFNNDIGLPLTLLRLEAQHQFAVVELGANHIGEIAYTSSLVKPDVALVNNVMPAHLEGFGSLEGVAKAKAEIWSNLSSDGIAVVNLDANFAQQFMYELEKKQQRFICFSKSLINENSDVPDVFATNIISDKLGQASFQLNMKPTSLLQEQSKNQSITEKKITIKLNLPGLHNVSNALAASSIALALGCSLNNIKQGLEAVQQVPGRLNYHVVNDDLIIIDDTYNANSASVNAGIDLLAQFQGKRLLVCGDMGELGAYAEREHQAIGEYAQQHHIEGLFTVGSLSHFATNAYNAASQNTCAKHFADKKSLKSAVNAYLSGETSKIVVLVKGSRSAKMEELVTFIQENFSA